MSRLLSTGTQEHRSRCLNSAFNLQVMAPTVRVRRRTAPPTKANVKLAPIGATSERAAGRDPPEGQLSTQRNTGE